MSPKTTHASDSWLRNAAMLALCAGSAQAEPVRVIFSKLPESDTSLVPGALDANGQAATTRFRAITDLMLSPDGSSWMVRGATQQGNSLDSILLRGSGTTGSRFIQEGQQFPSGSISETYDLLGRGSFNIKNEFGFSTSTRGGAIAQSIATVLWDGATFSAQVHSGDSVSGLIDIEGNVSGDELIGGFVDSAHLLNSGQIGAHFESIENIDVLRERALAYGPVAFQQIGVSTVTGLNGAGVETWARWDAEPFHTTPDGQHWIAIGKVLGDRDFDAVAVVDGQIVVREGFDIPGTAVTAAGFNNGSVIACGEWFVRGSDTSGQAWALRSGVLIAKAGDPVPDEPGATWGTAFYAVTGNCTGAWALAGRTVDLAVSDDVIAVTGFGVVVREGDPVDVNGDGLFNDDAFIGRGNSSLAAFESDQIAMSDDGVLYFIANLRNAAGQDLNSNPVFGNPTAFMRISLFGAHCPVDFDGDGFVTGADFDQFVAAFESGSVIADFDGDGFVTGVDFDMYVIAFETGC